MSWDKIQTELILERLRNGLYPTKTDDQIINEVLHEAMINMDFKELQAKEELKKTLIKGE